MSRNDIDKLRQSDQWYGEEVSRSRHSPDGGTPTRLVVTATKTTYPTTAATFYYCTPQDLTGAEVEGGAGTITAGTSGSIYALNLGTAIPAVGTEILATFIGNRWCFRYDG